jgi:1-acyl-sn-glycerol-3-phosphate acyltransferase
MTESTAGTSDYWRKLIGADEGVEPDALSKYDYHHKALRPLFFFLFGLCARSYWKINAVGTENLPARHPYIVAPNHTSALDYPVVAWAMGQARNDLYVLATKHFYDLPPARFFMKIAANVARIDTVDDFLPALRAAVKILKRGKSIYINPEGTRSTTGELLPFRPGVGMLAVELDVPIVPVHIAGTHECMPPGSPFPKPGNIEVRFGVPISVDAYLPKLKDQNAYYVYKEVADELREKVQGLKSSGA